MTLWNLIESLLTVYITHPEYAKLDAHIDGVTSEHTEIDYNIVGKDIYISGKDEKDG